MNDFFQRLKERKLVQWAIAYVAAAFALLQGLDIVGQQFGWPESVRRGITLAFVVGFFVCLILAWYHGERGAQRVTGTELLIIGLVLAVGGGFLWRFSAVSRKSDDRSVSRPNEINVAEPSEVIPEKSIAVLPFENLSSDAQNAYFAEGIQDEILTKLAALADLKVISRTSTAKYKSKPEDLKTVSRQLGVAKVLEGTVQRAGNKVRVNVQLIDARADSHLWAKSYDGAIDDVFEVESKVSQEVAEALQARISSKEASQLGAAPTNNTEAYDIFLKGEFAEREAESSLKPQVYDEAAELYRKALELDPKFALAMARLVFNQMQRHWFVEPMTEARLQQVKQVVEQALQLAPNLPQAHVAKGVYHYFGYRQYDQALTEFQRAIKLQPNNEQAFEYCSYIHRRRGEWAEGLAGLSQSLKQSPRDASLAANLSNTHTMLRMWAEAERYGRMSLDLNPRTRDAMRTMLITSINGHGDIKEARQRLQAFPPDAVLVADAGHATVEGLIGWPAYLDVLEGNYAAALRIFEGQSSEVNERVRLAARTVIHVFAGDSAKTRQETEEARRLIETHLKERPNDLDATTQLSWIYLALDDKAEAVQFAQKATDLMPPEKDALSGVYTLYNLAVIKARTGDAPAAIAILKRLLAMPAGNVVTVGNLKLNPYLTPIRKDPGFQDLVASREQIGPNK